MVRSKKWFARHATQIIPPAPGGYICIPVPHNRSLGNMYKTARCRAGIKSKMKHFGFPWNIYSFDRKSLNAILGKAGFSPVTFEF